MAEYNQFAESMPREDLALCDGDTENNDLTSWNDTPPHENGEGPDGNGMAVIPKEEPPVCGCECAQPARVPGGASYEDEIIQE